MGIRDLLIECSSGGYPVRPIDWRIKSWNSVPTAEIRVAHGPVRWRTLAMLFLQGADGDFVYVVERGAIRLTQEP